MKQEIVVLLRHGQNYVGVVDDGAADFAGTMAGEVESVAGGGDDGLGCRRVAVPGMGTGGTYSQPLSQAPAGGIIPELGLAQRAAADVAGADIQNGNRT